MPEPPQRSWSRIRQALTCGLYDAGMSIVVWSVLVPWAALTQRRGRLRPTDLQEWLAAEARNHGEASPARAVAAAAPRVIVHAVSAGEATAAVHFVEALGRERPSWRVVMTAGNKDALAVAEAARARLTTIEAVVRLPWDRHGALVRWLRRAGAAAVVVVEPEFWPGLYRACATLGLPLLLVNARVYPRDVARYRWIRGFMRGVLHSVTWIGAQDAAAARALVAIGAPADRVVVTGNLKFDGDDRSAAAHPLALRLAAARDGGARLIVAGSTHPDDERCLLAAFVQLRHRVPELRLVLAPRHVVRAPGIIAAVKDCGLAAERSSSPDSAAAWDVLVLDRLGDLPSIYGVADVAVVGGTFGTHGGHNVAEPARAGRPIVIGPSVDNIRDIVARLQAADAVLQVGEASAGALAAACEQLLAGSESAAAMGARARACHEAASGAASRSVLALVEAVESGAAAGLSARAPSPAASATWRHGASEAASSATAVQPYGDR
jgi:3-deoxy-D-manno-octulosonic-acid transferase